MEGLVSELCIADRMFADSDFHGNRIQNTITFSEGVYDLLRDGVNVQYPSSFVLLLTKVIRFRALAVLCVGLSFLFLMALILFKGKEFKEEMHKKLHV